MSHGSACWPAKTSSRTLAPPFTVGVPQDAEDVAHEHAQLRVAGVEVLVRALRGQPGNLPRSVRSLMESDPVVSLCDSLLNCPLFTLVASPLKVLQAELRARNCSRSAHETAPKVWSRSEAQLGQHAPERL